MTERSNREILSDAGYDGSVVFDNPEYDEAIIGATSNGKIVYDYDKMIECLVKRGVSEADAVDFISYNTLRALDYQPDGPIVMFGIEGWM